MADGQDELDLGLVDTAAGGGPLKIVSSRSAHVWDGLCRAYGVLGVDRVLDGDDVLCGLVLARIIEPTSKIDAERVLTETGVSSASDRTVERRLPVIAKHGDPNRLKLREIRSHRTSLPHRHDQGRQPNPDRRRPITG